MNFPINAFTEFSLDTSLIVSLLVGLGFGFMLEKGGFGNSKILAGIFYGRDWRVLKVMFSAIVTAMVGLYALDGIGVVAMDRIAFKSTYLWSQIVGGLLLGIGFVTSGYCPGTSVVGIVSGRLDALFAMGGMLLGIGLFEEGFPLWKEFYNSAYMGEVSISQWSGLPTGLIVFSVALMAFGAFSAVGHFERKSRGETLPKSAWRGITAIVGGGLLAATVQFAGPGAARAMASHGDYGNVPGIGALEVASWTIEGRTNFMLIDLRPEGASPELPGAYPIEADALVDLRKRPALPKDRVIVIADEDDSGPAREVVASLRVGGFDAVYLERGASGFQAEVLDESASAPPAAAFRLMKSGKSVFGGAAPPPAPLKKKAPPKRKKKKSTGCS
jgi:uncharacterized protein